MTRHLLTGTAMMIGLSVLLSAGWVMAEDGPIVPGLDSLPPIDPPPRRRALPAESQIEEPPATMRSIERRADGNLGDTGRDARDARPDPFGDTPRSDRPTTIERHNSGPAGLDNSRTPQRVMQARPPVQSYRQSPQQPAQMNPATQRYRQQTQTAPTTRGPFPSNGGSSWNDPAQAADPRQGSTMRRAYPDPRAAAGNRPDAQRNAVQQRPTQPPLRVQQTSPKAQPSMQPRSTQAPRGMQPWNGSGAPARTGQPSAGQRRR